MKLKQKLKKIPAPLEILIGGVIVCVPPFPDPSDILGLTLVGHGIHKLKHKAKTCKFNGKKYVLFHRTKFKSKAYSLKDKLKKYNYVRVTKSKNYYYIWVRKK